MIDKKKKRKNALPRMSGKNIQKGSMYGQRQNSRHPTGINPNNADRELSKMKRSGVGP